MATVCHPATGQVTASFAAVAKHYGCRWRSARRGAGTARAWWRRPTTSPRNGCGAPWPTTSRVEQAQARLDRGASRGDTRLRATADGKATVATVAAPEPLRPVPGAVPGRADRARGSSARRRWSSFRGNRYSVPPELARRHRHRLVRLGAAHLDIATAWPAAAAGR